MSDEHNKPENSSVAKPLRPRRTSAKKAAPETAADAQATPAEAPTAPKAAKPRLSRSKSAATPKAGTAEEGKAPTPKKTATRPPRKTTPKKSAEAEAAEVQPTSVDAAATDTPAKASKKPPRTAARKSPRSTTAPSAATSPVTDTGEATDAGAVQNKPAPKPQSRRTPKSKPVVAKGSSPEMTAAPAPVEPASPAAPTPPPDAAPARQDAPAAPKVAAAPAVNAAPQEVMEHIAAVQTAPVQEASALEESGEGDDAAPSAPRKSRRGRRGGRGRSRKSRQAASSAELGAVSAPDDMDEELADTEVEATEAEATTTAPKAASSKKDGGRRDSGKKATKSKEKELEAESKPGRRKMFISVVPGEQVEVALVEEGVIGEYYLDMLHQAKTKGNIYKGVVHNVDPNLQAAFVNYGTNKNGFLQIDEIHPEYYLTHHEAAKGKKYPPIQKVIKPGQEVLVQVVKEPTGNKGAFLTTWLSLAGRFLVLTPGQEQIGVSRKVDNDEERARLREMMNGIEPGEGLGVIVRTVSAGTSKTTLKNDLQYLKRVWKEIRRRGTSESAPCNVYQESSLAERAVRDYLTEDVVEVWVDNESVAESLRDTVALLFPRKEDLVRVHADVRQTLWERFNIQRQLEQIYSREVTLPSGGRLVFDQTEALMAIDINSGKISGKANFESMALKTNLEAAEAIARHLKLRDIGGQVVIDFIEMRDKSHVREVEKTLRNAMKNDRARHDVARMSSFGLLEIVRQRTGSSALAVTMEPCPCCNGTGIRRNMEWQSLQALRQIGRQARTPGTTRCVFETNAELGMYLLNHKRDRLREMEQQLNVPIEIRIQP